MNIGKSVVIKGELSGSEDLTIEGQVDGKIELRQNVLTIGPNGKIKAQVFAKSVVILGEVTGNVTASEKVDIRDNGSVDGDIAAPRVAIAEGAHFRGSIDMQRPAAPAKPAEKAEAKPAAAAPSQPAAASPADVRRDGRRVTLGPHGQPSDRCNRRDDRVMMSGAWRARHGRCQSSCPTSGSNAVRYPQVGRETPGTCDVRLRSEVSPQPAVDEPVVGSKAFPKFLAALRQQPSPVLLDFGPVIGTNVEFFGERLGCKLFIEDIVGDVDRHTKAGTLDALPGLLETRFRHADAQRRRHPVLGRLRFPRQGLGSGPGQADHAHAAPGRRRDGPFLHGRQTDHAVHEVRDCRRRQFPPPRPPRRRRRRSGPSRTATSSGCSKGWSSPTRSCSRATSAKCCSAADSSDTSPVSFGDAPSDCAPQRLRDPGPLRRDDEGRHPGDLSRT